MASQLEGSPEQKLGLGTHRLAKDFGPILKFLDEVEHCESGELEKHEQNVGQAIASLEHTIESMSNELSLTKKATEDIEEESKFTQEMISSTDQRIAGLDKEIEVESTLRGF